METINARRDRDTAQHTNLPLAGMSLDQALALFDRVAPLALFEIVEAEMQEVCCG